MSDKQSPRLTFVYNADSTLIAAAEDFITRIVAPGTYACNLCMITYGPVSMRTPWRAFLDSLPNEKIFLHRDEFHKKYPNSINIALPAVLADSAGDFEVVVSADEINNVTDAEALKKLLMEKLRGLHP